MVKDPFAQCELAPVVARAIDEQTPVLVVGADLIPGLRSRSTKEKLAPGQMFCLGCKSPSYPDAGLIDDFSKPK